MAVMIGIDPHKASHTAVALDDSELFLGELRVRSAADQLERLVGWAAGFGERTWAIEGAGGLGYLLAQQLVAAGERVVDVQPKLAARVRLLATGDSNKNDPNDARSVAVAALRSCDLRVVQAEDHAAVMKMWAKRHRDLGRQHTRVAWWPDTNSPVSSSPTWSASRCSAARPAAGSPPRSSPRQTTVTEVFGVGAIVAATVIGDVGDMSRFPTRDHFAAYNGTAPIEVSSEGRRKVFRLSRRGNRRMNHAIHMAAGSIRFGSLSTATSRSIANRYRRSARTCLIRIRT